MCACTHWIRAARNLRRALEAQVWNTTMLFLQPMFWRRAALEEYPNCIIYSIFVEALLLKVRIACSLVYFTMSGNKAYKNPTLTHCFSFFSFFSFFKKKPTRKTKPTHQRNKNIPKPNDRDCFNNSRFQMKQWSI